MWPEKKHENRCVSWGNKYERKAKSSAKDCIEYKLNMRVQLGFIQRISCYLGFFEQRERISSKAHERVARKETVVPLRRGLRIDVINENGVNPHQI